MFFVTFACVSLVKMTLNSLIELSFVCCGNTVLSKSNENEVRQILPIVLAKYRQTFPEISEQYFAEMLATLGLGKRNIAKISAIFCLEKQNFTKNGGKVVKSNKISHRRKFSQTKFRSHEKSPTKYHRLPQLHVRNVIIITVI